ncbi:MAG: oxidoreductase domain protein [Conexibacter sp.]|jgi:predicted dehydrogenase|nr:oxidoreductase domain protein [Conexibacter sp.]
MSVPSTAIGIAGFGYWGTKLARNVAEAPGSVLAAICDADADRRAAADEQYAVATHADVDALIADPTVDAVVLATPAGDHYAQARAALFAGKHVMVEKPLALSTEHCDELQRLAADRGLTLMTGHTFLYSAPVRMLKDLIDSGDLGDVLYCYSQRLNLGAIRSDTSAMWDLAPHDVSIFLHLLGATPAMVSAQQFSLIDDRHEDIAMVTMTFPGGAVGHLHVSRLDPRKVRELTIVGSRKMAVYDDTNPEMPVRVYDSGVERHDDGLADSLMHADFARHNLELRSGDITAPRVVGREPLRVEIEDFAACCASGATPVSSAQVGRDVVAVLEAADRSSVLGGEPMTPAEVADARAAA